MGLALSFLIHSLGHVVPRAHGVAGSRWFIPVLSLPCGLGSLRCWIYLWIPFRAHNVAASQQMYTEMYKEAALYGLYFAQTNSCVLSSWKFLSAFLRCAVQLVLLSQED